MTPSEPNALLAAVRWIEAALLGSIAIGIAVLAIAAVGVLMLSGRIDLRRGATVVIGCFILFGAPRIAQGLRGAGEALTADDTMPPPVVVAAPVPTPTPTPPPQVYDPYAGAAVPRR